MFELMVTDTDITGGSIPVSWCIDPDSIEELTKQYGEDPQLVIVVAPVDHYHEKKETRTVVPLLDMMTYLDFKAPGHNKIWVFLCEEPSRGMNAKARYLSKDGGGFATSILDRSGKGWSWVFDAKSLSKGEYYGVVYEPKNFFILDINIPVTAFAPPPSDWDKVWVNYLFSNKSPDQCDYRRRRLLAYTVQFPLMGLFVCLRFLATLVSLLIGARNFSVKPLLHPISSTVGDQLDILGGGSIFIRELDDNFDSLSTIGARAWFLVRKFCLLPLMPVILVPLVWLAVSYTATFVVVAQLLAMVLLFLAVVVLAIVGGIAFFAANGVDKVKNFFARKPKPIVTFAEEAELLVCLPDRKLVTMANLPDSKKTIKLRYLNLKNKVCKPFSA